MRRISIDNGNSFVTPIEAIGGMSWEVLVRYMDEEICEAVHAELAPCSNEVFLVRYLELASEDLIVG